MVKYIGIVVLDANPHLADHMVAGDLSVTPMPSRIRLLLHTYSTSFIKTKSRAYRYYFLKSILFPYAEASYLIYLYFLILCLVLNL